jgi:hypothetical protein
MMLAGLVDMIDSPNREHCLRLWRDNVDLWGATRGSSHNHQAWAGGYLEHVKETMEIAVALYSAHYSLLAGPREFPFTLADALLVLFLHDLEKPWKELDHVRAGLRTKAQREAFRLTKIVEYGIELTPVQSNALKYVEGEGDDYRSDVRVMSELAAFCHMCDVASARIWHGGVPWMAP